ncbi:MAG: diacylglycerol kinase family protein [Acidobacteriota bacterium]
MLIVAIINPISGPGADPASAARRVALVRAEAGRRGLRPDIYLTERAGHARELAASSAAAGADLVIVWGGDGTLNEAGAGLLGSTTAIGLVPSGSGNGLAVALGVPRDPLAALAVAFDGGTRIIDAGLMAGRPFFNIAGIGFDARIAKLFNERGSGRRGGWPYVVLGVREGCRYRAIDYHLQLDGQSQDVRALLLAFANGREYGNGARIAPQAELDDGVLDAIVVGECRVMARFWHARHMAMGTAHLAPNVAISRVTHAIVETDGAMEFHVDGEPGVAHGSIEVRMLPGALRVRAALPTN